MTAASASATLRYYERQTVIAACSRDHGGMPSRVLEVRPGHGRHVHSAECGDREGNRLSCLRHCDDSDLVVELAYVCEDGPDCYPGHSPAGHEHHAIYGLLDGAFILWAD